MKTHEIENAIDTCRKAGVVLNIISEAGIGKSQVVKDYCTKKKIGFVDLRLGQMEVGDLLGMPTIENNKTTWAKPKWFPESGKGILFLDESMRARPDILQAVFQLFLDRKINEHELPSGWSIVTANNPQTDDYNLTIPDKALESRMIHVLLEPSIPNWVKWAKTNKLNKELINYVDDLKHQEGELLGGQTKMPFKIRPNARRLEFASKIIQNCEDEVILRELLDGTIGPEHTTAYLEYAKNEKKILNFHDILNGTKYNYTPDSAITINNELLETLKDVKLELDETKSNNIIVYLSKLPADMVLPLLKQFGTTNENTRENMENILMNADNDKVRKLYKKIGLKDPYEA